MNGSSVVAKNGSERLRRADIESMRRTVALPRQLVRACTAARGARRRFSTSYYDSQSGEHVQRVDGLLLHELSLSASTSLRPEQLSESSVGTRLSSFELPLSAISKDKLTGLPLAFARLTEQEHTADMVGRCAELGVGASLSLKVGNGLGADAAITKVIRVAEVAAESGAGGVLVRACLLDALGHDSPSRVELVCAKLADAGVSVLTLGGEEGREIDEDEMEELVEALIQADVVGTPMQDRVRASGYGCRRGEKKRNGIGRERGETQQNRRELIITKM